MTAIILNGQDITDVLDKLIIHEGTKNSSVTILKLRYLDGSVDTKVLLPHNLHHTHKIIRR